MHGRYRFTVAGLLFAAGMIPGVLAGLALMIPAVWMARRHKMGAAESALPRPPFWQSLREASWGLFARHVKNLDVHRVEFRVAQTDLRPVVRLDDATGTSFDSVKFPRTADTPVFVLKDVTGFEIHRSAGLPETARTDKIADEKL